MRGASESLSQFTSKNKSIKSLLAVVHGQAGRSGRCAGAGFVAREVVAAMSAKIAANEINERIVRRTECWLWVHRMPDARLSG